MPVHTLTTLEYSDDRKGPFRLYVYQSDGYHRGGIWVDRNPQADEIGVTEMMFRALEAAAQGLEVRICDTGDRLVYHCVGLNVLYPKPIGNFWLEVTEAK